MTQTSSQDISPLENPRIISVHTVFSGAALMAVGWMVYANVPYPEAAAFPGALIGLFISLALGRADWQKRWRDFALFGAVGWSLGGMMPLEYLVGYTNAGAQFWQSMLYGIAGLSLIGFLWAGIGGLLTALPAVLDEEDLQACRTMIHWLIGLWCFGKILLFLNLPPQENLDAWIQAFFIDPDIDSVSALAYLPAWFKFHGLVWGIPIGLSVIAWGGYRMNPKLSLGFDLVLQSVIGWFAGIGVFVGLLGYRLSPPASDAWAGLAGMLYMLIQFLIRNRRYNCRPAFRSLLFITMMTAFWGAAAFPVANSIRLYLYTLNALYPDQECMSWVLGMMNGVGMMLAFGYAAAYFCPNRHSGESNRVVFNNRLIFLLFLLFLLISVILYHAVFMPWVKNGMVTRYPHGFHLSVWITAAAGMIYLTVGMIRLRTSVNPMAAGSIPESVAARWLLTGLLWYGILLVFARNDIGYMAVWLYAFIWVIGCVLTYRVMIPPQDQPPPEAENLWQKEMSRRTMHHVLSWIIITALIVTGLSAFHTRIILYPTKGHHFRFGPNAWTPEIERQQEPFIAQ